MYSVCQAYLCVLLVGGVEITHLHTFTLMGFPAIWQLFATVATHLWHTLVFLTVPTP